MTLSLTKKRYAELSKDDGILIQKYLSSSYANSLKIKTLNIISEVLSKD